MSIEIDCFVERYSDGKWRVLTHDLRDLQAQELRSTHEFDFGVGGIGGNCYELFSLLGRHGGGRSSLKNLPPPIIPLRGLPENCSQQLQRYAEQMFAKAPGWLLLDELRGYYSERKENLPEFLVNILGKSIAKLSSVGAGDEVRIVFWFDN